MSSADFDAATQHADALVTGELVAVGWPNRPLPASLPMGIQEEYAEGLRLQTVLTRLHFAQRAMGYALTQMTRDERERARSFGWNDEDTGLQIADVLWSQWSRPGFDKLRASPLLSAALATLDRIWPNFFDLALATIGLRDLRDSAP